jgi:glycosyltransferase involved in cell wall biosynthesis
MLENTLKSVEAQKRDVDVRVVMVVPVAARKARDLGEAFGATLIDDPQSGMSAAINEGIRARNGEDFYAWIGDDDLYRPGGLQTLQSLLDQNPGAVMAYGACEYIDETNKVLGVSRAGALAKYVQSWGPNLIPHPGSMFRLDNLQAIGCFDVDLKFAMDLDVMLKLKKTGRFVATKKIVSAFRWHPDSLTVANHNSSIREANSVRARHLPAAVRPFRFLWQRPLGWASTLAAIQLNRRAR